MSTLPLLFSDRYRRNSVNDRPHKIGGMFSLELGQLKGPFLDKDFHLMNKKSIGVLTSRSFNRRNSADASRIISATYTTFPKHLAYIPEQTLFQQDEIQTFRTNSHTIEQELRVSNNKLGQSKQEVQQIRSELTVMSKQMEQQLRNTEQNILMSFKELRSRLFEFSRSENNTHLMLVKKEVAAYKQTLQCLQAHYSYADQKLQRLQNQFKGKEASKHH